jgi:phage gpG-like protein
VDLSKIVAGASKEYFKRVMVIVHKDVVVHAPVQQKEKKAGRGKARKVVSGKGNKLSGGTLRKSLAPGGGVTSYTDTQAVIGTNVHYAKYLDDNKGTGRYHYRSGPRQGEVTTGWFSGAVERMAGELDAALATVAKDIETGWERG